jgi:hypothetical protein
MHLKTVVVLKNADMALKKLLGLGLKPIMGVYNPQGIHKCRGREFA